MSAHSLKTIFFAYAFCLSSVRADVPSTVLGHEIDQDALVLLQTAKPRSLSARDEKAISVSKDGRASFVTTQMDCSDCSGTEIPRGATWCELNPLSAAIEPGQMMQAILACVVDEESPHQKTQNDCCPHSLFMGVTNNKSTPSPAAVQLSKQWPDYFNRLTVLYNGQKKRLWDRQYSECTGGEEEADPEDFLYVKTSTDLEMWFKWGSNSTPTGVPAFGGGTQEYVYVNPMMAKSFNAGMRQPVIRTDYGAVFVLQSYLTEQQDSNGSWVPSFPGCTTEPGVEDDICDYFLTCCHGLPPTWHAECGFLESTVNCGKSSCQGNVTIDDISGAWCQVQDGDAVDVCGNTYGEAACGCPGMPPCGESAVIA